MLSNGLVPLPGPHCSLLVYQAGPRRKVLIERFESFPRGVAQRSGEQRRRLLTALASGLFPLLPGVQTPLLPLGSD